VAQSQFQAESVYGMSWVRNVAVQETFARALPQRSLVVDWSRDIGLDQLEQQLRSSAGQTLLVIAAVVDGHLVAWDEQGARRFSIPWHRWYETVASLDMEIVLFDCAFGPGPKSKPDEDKLPDDEFVGRAATGLAHSLHAAGTATFLDFVSRFAREMAGVHWEQRHNVVGLIQSPATSRHRSEPSRVLSLETRFYCVQSSGDSMRLGEPAGRIFCLKPARDPYRDKAHVLAVRIGVAALSLLAAGILAGFCLWLRRAAPREGGRPAAPGLPVQLYYEPLRELNLTDQTVEDAALRQLSTLPGIKRLHLAGSSITDAGLKHIAKCKSLEIVTLRQTKVTTRGVQWLRRKLPGCQIRLD
jgi:hypothetical protein